MNYHNITTDDMLNGEGLRTVLWVSGCSHCCKGCHNRETWNPESGIKFDNDAIYELLTKLSQPQISGLTLSGGDPLYPDNRDEILNLCKLVKSTLPNKTIWLYTGYTYDEICKLEILDYIDVLVEGRYIEELNDNTIEYRGSSNQSIIRFRR